MDISELAVDSYIKKTGRAGESAVCLRKSRGKLLLLKDKFMFSLGYVPTEDTVKEQK